MVNSPRFFRLSQFVQAATTPIDRDHELAGRVGVDPIQPGYMTAVWRRMAWPEKTGTQI